MMKIAKNLSNQFDSVILHVRQTHHLLSASGSAVIVIHNDKVVTEEYIGRHSKSVHARPITEDSQFHVASVRKSYIGFAAAYSIYKGYISSIDDPVTKYLSIDNDGTLSGTTIRHLLTHTHGLRNKNGKIIREFIPGESWAYHGVGTDLICEIIKNTTDKTISEIVSNEVFKPLGLKASNWYAVKNEKLVEVIREREDPHWKTFQQTDGSKMNMYVSALELAYWGYFHLNEGFINNKQIVPKDIIRLATSLQSPPLKDHTLPQNGFFWFVKDLPTTKTEIGELVPKGSYQILGYTNTAVLVIPQHEVVAVCMLNRFGSPKGYQYLKNIRAFGDTVMKCL
ncbi:serine hydrolase domain-containing protein [Bacillus aquiflavi]|nr:serine hydrolase domain-containing protein [Bacillus aquiflavi]